MVEIKFINDRKIVVENASDVSEALKILADRNENLIGMYLSGSYLYSVNFSRYIARYSDFRSCVFSGFNTFSNADLEAADFSGAKGKGLDFNGANLKFSKFVKVDLEGVDFSDADLEGADFSGANLAGANFSRANLRNAKFEKANLSNSDIRLACLVRADFGDSDMESSFMNNVNAYQATFCGACLVNAIMRDANFSDADFLMANLEFADIVGSDFSYSNLSKAMLPVFPEDAVKIFNANFGYEKNSTEPEKAKRPPENTTKHQKTVGKRPAKKRIS